MGGAEKLKTDTLTDTQTDRDQHQSLSSVTHPEREGRRVGRRRADGGANTWGRALTAAGWTGSSRRPPAPPADSPGTTRSWTHAPPTPGSCCTSCHGRWLQHGKTLPSVKGRQAAREARPRSKFHSQSPNATRSKEVNSGHDCVVKPCGCWLSLRIKSPFFCLVKVATEQIKPVHRKNRHTVFPTMF